MFVLRQEKGQDITFHHVRYLDHFPSWRTYKWLTSSANYSNQSSTLLHFLLATLEKIGFLQVVQSIFKFKIFLQFSTIYNRYTWLLIKIRIVRIDNKNGMSLHSNKVYRRQQWYYTQWVPKKEKYLHKHIFGVLFWMWKMDS